jgi:hypothetical protein
MDMKEIWSKIHQRVTNYWKNIGEFPFDGIPAEFSGKFVWVAQFICWRVKISALGKIHAFLFLLIWKMNLS